MHQLLELTRAEWKLREQSSLLGFLWTLLHPILLCASLYGIFSQWFGGGRRGYAPAVLIGMLQFGFFSSATAYGMASLARRRALLRNFLVRPSALVVAAVMSSAISHLLQLGCMAVVLVFLGGVPGAAWLMLAPLFLMNLAFALGLSFLLAPAAVAFPDLPRVWSAVTGLLFFLTPVVYRLESLDGRRRALVALNPLTHLIEISRGCLLSAQWPPPTRTAALALACAAFLAVGRAAFKAQEKLLADGLLG